MAGNADDFVPVIGVIHLHTSVGTFLDVGEHRIFVPQFSTSTLLRRTATSLRRKSARWRQNMGAA